MTLTQKERSLLEDLKKEEQLCVEKYSHYSSEATDPKLSELFSEIGSTEQQHLKTVNGMLSGTAPSLKQTQQNKTVSKTPGRKPKKKNTNEQDAYLCSDVLSTEKHVSAVYNTSIFEFAQPDLREALNHIQKEEQQHGEKIYDYMARNDMY